MKKGILSLAFVALSSISHAAEPPKDVISKDKAQATALKKYPGEIKSSELEKEKGRWIYSFDIQGEDRKIHEVWVDARKNKVVGQKVESAAEEAREKSGEAEKSPE